MTQTVEKREDGSTVVHYALSEKDKLALDQAHKIAAQRFQKAGVKYDRESANWRFLGELRDKGIPGLIDYATNAKLPRKKVCGRYVGYAEYSQE